MPLRLSDDGKNPATQSGMFFMPRVIVWSKLLLHLLSISEYCSPLLRNNLLPCPSPFPGYFLLCFQNTLIFITAPHLNNFVFALYFPFLALPHSNCLSSAMTLLFTSFSYHHPFLQYCIIAKILQFHVFLGHDSLLFSLKNWFLAENCCLKHFLVYCTHFLSFAACSSPNGYYSLY